MKAEFNDDVEKYLPIISFRAAIKYNSIQFFSSINKYKQKNHLK